MGDVVTLFSAKGAVIRVTKTDNYNAVNQLKRFHYVGGGCWRDDDGTEYEVFRG